MAVSLDVSVRQAGRLRSASGEKVMRRLVRGWHLWAPLLGLVILLELAGIKPASAHAILDALKNLVLKDTGNASLQEQSPLPPAVDVGGPSTVGGVQLVDMTAHYSKTDLVIQTSIGPFAFTRTFRTNAGVTTVPFNDYVTKPQWSWAGLTGYAWHDTGGGGFVITPQGCKPQNPDCQFTRHADYVVEDPDTGTQLTFYTPLVDGGVAVPVTGFQVPGDATNPAKLYVLVSGSIAEEYILFKPTVHYYFPDGAFSYLSRVEDAQYRTLATINYTSSSSGVISSVTTADQVEVIFTNSDAGVLQSISVTAPDAGSTTTVASYSYTGALLGGVVYSETGTGETYSYGTNANAFTVTARTGQPIVSYAVDAGPYGAGGGNGAVSSETTEETILNLTGWYFQPWGSCPQGTSFCSTRTFTDSLASAGDGTLSSVTVSTSYALTSPDGGQGSNVGTGPQTGSVTISYGTNPNAQSSWQFYPGFSATEPGGHEGVPPNAQWSVSANGAYTVYADAGLTSSSSVPSNAGFYLPVEYPFILAGASNSSGAGALSMQSRQYEYGGVGRAVQGYEQLVSSRTQPSRFGGTVTTYYNWDTLNNRVNSVVRVGMSSVDPSFETEKVSIGTIYKYDTLGRVTEVDGPCFVTGTTPLACNTPATAPITQYAYYSAGVGYNSNRLMTKTVCTTSACSVANNTALATAYSSYDARGHATLTTDPNGVETKLTYQGDHLIRKEIISASNDDVTQYTYDGDQLLITQQPSSMFDVTCHRIGTSDTGCATGGNPSKYLQWKARCSTPTCSAGSVISRVVYQYRHGFASSETYYDASGQVRRVVRHDRDPLNRPTFDAVGDSNDSTDATYSSRAMFDADGNQIAVGFPYNAPPSFCNSGTSSTCALMSYDRLDRLVALSEPLLKGGGSSQVTVGSDSLGNVSAITFNGQTVTYSYDDFGNLLSVAAPWLSGGSSPIFYSYDAQGHILAKRTPSMVLGESLQYDYDMAGRPLDLKRYLGGYTTLWALSYDTSTPSGPNCPPAGKQSFTLGRVQLRTDSFGQTWYTYNFRGQVLSEVRVRTGGNSCAPVQTAIGCQLATNDATPNTVYSYAITGQLQAIQYPHGRSVSFLYGSDGDVERVSSLSVGLNVAGTCNGYTLLSKVTWEPYGGLRGYEIDAPTPISSAKASVEYLLGDNSTVSPNPVCPPASRPSGTSSDHSGRVRALWVSTGAYSPYSPTGTGNIFGLAYTWQGDQLVSQATCLLQTSGAALVENFFSGTQVSGYNTRLQLEHASRPPSGKTNTGGAWGQRDYTYDSRGNRLLETTDCWNWAETYTNDQLMSRAVTGNVCSATCVGTPTFLTTNYTYDADGRVLTLTSPSDSVGPPLSFSFNSTVDGQAAVGSVYKAITVNDNSSPLTFEYWYDANGQRRLKVYPDGEEDEYFYGLNSELLEDHENCPSCGTNTLDEYVWLGGRPVILLRGNVNSTGALNSDFSGTCADFGHCGVYFPVTDYLGKPVLLLDSSLLVAGAADYDLFGHVNRVVAAGDTPHPYAAAPAAQVVAGFRQAVPVGASFNLIARARLAMVDTDSVSGAYASLTDLKVSPLQQYPAGSGTVGNVGGPHFGATVTNWAMVPGSGSPFPWQFQVRFMAASASTSNPPRSGVAVAGYEYRKYQAGSTPTWLPLRFPGQYYDAETDLFQNWNRFYDANVGRFLEPEPMWLYPEKLVRMAGRGRSAPVYAYATNNPINGGDPNGLEGIEGSGVTEEEEKDILEAQAANLNTPFAKAVFAVFGGAAAGAIIAGGAAIAGVSLGIAALTMDADLAVGTLGAGASKVAASVDLGEAGEVAAGIVKNTDRIPSLTGTAAYRIPDVLDHAAELIGEVKNVAYQPLTNQLQDFVQYSQQNNYTFQLTTRVNTILSGPLQDLVNRGQIVLNNTLPAR
jgi:RHS repeat-associated protein